MGYWKDKVIPNIKKVFDKNGTKKAAAAEATKIFNESKEQYTTDFEEKKTELQPKVIEIYEASSIKSLVKEPKDAGIKKQSAGVQKFLDELAKIEFPGAKAVSESSSKFGPANVIDPIQFVFEKVSIFVVTDEKKEEAPTAPEAAVEATSKDIAVEETKKEAEAAEAATVAETTKAPPAEAVVEEPPAVTERAPAP